MVRPDINPEKPCLALASLLVLETFWAFTLRTVISRMPEQKSPQLHHRNSMHSRCLQTSDTYQASIY